jgi:predicted RND superfamily exporter protein
VRERLRLSAHFHRFQILLYIFFTAALMISFGFALTLSTSSILGWIGIILSGGGIVVGIGVGAVLLTLFAFYLIRWRKDPTGYKPPRNPHPPKDR